MMEFIRDLPNLNASQAGCVVSIGNFDGVHLGHQQLLHRLKQQAQALQLKSTVIIFEPQPNEYFATAEAPPRLMRLREKLQVLKNYGIDRIVCLRFNALTAQLSAEDFISKILHQSLAARYVLVGDDFRFGYQRAGDFALLKKLAQQYSFHAEQMPTALLGGERVSSTRIRRLLQQGDLLQAAKLLGRAYRLSGHVAYGDARGRTLGFPTANIYLRRKAAPLSGVFVVNMYGITAQPLQGVANVGTRPTFAGGQSLLEVHLLDFKQMIYGRFVEVEFIHKLRDEQRFASLETLKQQILNDVQQARDFFAQQKNLLIASEKQQNA